MEKWSGAYAFVKVLAYYTFWLSHKRIAVIGKENIPRNKPIIFAPNHQNALMDPLAVLLTNYTQPVWMARADIFKLKATRPVLNFLKIVPVYRIRDGKKNLSKNKRTFDIAVRVLENKKAIALFPEAAHTGKRQMIMHKKAIPRIAFLAEEKSDFNLDVQIVPVGIYYNHYWSFNRSVLINYGKPIHVAGYEKIFRENEHTAIIALRDEIYKAMLSLVLNINSREFYDDYELMLKIAGPRYARTKNFNRDKFINRFFSDKELTGKIELLEKQDPESFKSLIGEIRLLNRQLVKLHLQGSNVRKLRSSDYVLLFVQLVAGIFSLSLFLPGFIFNGLQFLILRKVISNKVKDPLFRGSFNMVAGMLLFPVIHIVIATALGIAAGSLFLALFLFLVMLPLGKLSYQLFGFYRQIIRNIRIADINIFRNRELSSIVLLKKEVRNKIIDTAGNNSAIFDA